MPAAYSGDGSPGSVAALPDLQLLTVGPGANGLSSHARRGHLSCWKCCVGAAVTNA